MKNLVNDALKICGVLCVLTAVGVTACGGASSTQGSEPAKTTAVPASSGGVAPAGSAAGAAPGKDEIRAILKDHARDLKACYDREKDRGMNYKGDTKFQVKIDPAGKVADVHGVDVVPAGEFLSSCVSDSMKTWTFPASGKVSNVTIPITW
jgi:hypothetical protein